MRIAWVHPSWRDLVIEQLVGDDDARRHFLRSCGLDGALLALSSAGGGTGERNLPLLLGDGDWDALTERLHRLVPDLATAELGALLSALTTAPSLPGRQRAEAEALGEQVLGWVARRCDAQGTIGAELLAAWFELADQVPRPPASPHSEASLLASAPTFGMNLARPADCDRLDEWLWLAEIATRHKPADIFSVGFPQRYLPELGHLLRAAQTGGNREHVERIHRRVARLGIAIYGIRPPHPAGDDPDVEDAGRAQIAPVAATADASLVERVLRDL